MKSKDGDVKKYLTYYLPDLCYKAKQVRGLYNEPITLFIFEHMKQINKYNELGEFVIDDWKVFLNLIKQLYIDNLNQGSDKDRVSNIYTHVEQMLITSHTSQIKNS